MIRHTISLLLTALVATLWVTAQSPVHEVDRYFKAISAGEKLGLQPDFRLLSVTYGDDATPVLKERGAATLEFELEKIKGQMTFNQQPVVLLVREYGPMAQVMCSVETSFSPARNAPAVVNKQLVFFTLHHAAGGWTIDHAMVQNELPGVGFENHWWPDTSAFNPATETALQELKAPLEILEPAQYAAGSASLSGLMKAYGISQEPMAGWAPFGVVIGTDGSAKLQQTEGLSGYRLSQAEGFVRSLGYWQPANTAQGSVESTLVFYVAP